MPATYLPNTIWSIVFEYVQDRLGTDCSLWVLRHVCWQFRAVASSLIWRTVEVHVDSSWKYEAALATSLTKAIGKGGTSKEILLQIKELLRPPYRTMAVRLGLKSAVRSQEYGMPNCLLNEIERALKNKKERRDIIRGMVSTYLIPRPRQGHQKPWEGNYSNRKLSTDIRPFKLSDLALSHCHHIRHLKVLLYPQVPDQRDDAFNNYMFILAKLIKTSRLETIDIRFMGGDMLWHQSGMVMMIELLKLLVNAEGLTVRLFVAAARANCPYVLYAIAKGFEQLGPRASFALVVHEIMAPSTQSSNIDISEAPKELPPLINQFLVTTSFRTSSITPKWLSETIEECPNLRHMLFVVPQKVDGQPLTIVLGNKVVLVELLFQEDTDNSCKVIGPAVKRLTIGGFTGHQLSLLYFPRVEHFTLRQARGGLDPGTLEVGFRCLAQTMGAVEILETNETQLEHIPLALGALLWSKTIHIKLPKVADDEEERRKFYSQLAMVCRSCDLRPRFILEFFNDGPDTIVDDEDDEISDDEDYEEEGQPELLRQYKRKQILKAEESKRNREARQRELNAAKHVLQKFARYSNCSTLYIGHWFTGYHSLSDTEGLLIRLDKLSGPSCSPGITYYRVLPRYTVPDLKNKDEVVEESFNIVIN
ncbi:hypothetical protein TRVA0_023S01552 [Trichomonascus vanleenenianus]|uniref:uncharacterized protein n=1 Tax=Trichomonascus vanleenenianus TaxID=2268995 RepID=UPI003ECA57EB